MVRGPGKTATRGSLDPESVLDIMTPQEPPVIEVMSGCTTTTAVGIDVGWRHFAICRMVHVKPIGTFTVTHLKFVDLIPDLDGSATMREKLMVATDRIQQFLRAWRAVFVQGVDAFCIEEQNDQNRMSGGVFAMKYMSIFSGVIAGVAAELGIPVGNLEFTSPASKFVGLEVKKHAHYGETKADATDLAKGMLGMENEAMTEADKERNLAALRYLVTRKRQHDLADAILIAARGCGVNKTKRAQLAEKAQAAREEREKAKAEKERIRAEKKAAAEERKRVAAEKKVLAEEKRALAAEKKEAAAKKREEAAARKREAAEKKASAPKRQKVTALDYGDSPEWDLPKFEWPVVPEKPGE